MQSRANASLLRRKQAPSQAFVEDGGILRDSHDSDYHGMSIETLFGGGTLP
jgi:hypothetical protein